MEFKIKNMLKLNLEEDKINEIFNIIKNENKIEKDEENYEELENDELNNYFKIWLQEYDRNYTNSKGKTNYKIIKKDNNFKIDLNFENNINKDNNNLAYLKTFNQFEIIKDLAKLKHNFNINFKNNDYQIKFNYDILKNINFKLDLNNEENIIKLVGEIYENEDTSTLQKLIKIDCFRIIGILENKILN